MSKILVTGGCGYIGSHTIVDLMDNEYNVLSVDNNINSDPSVLDGIQQITGKNVLNYNIDLCSKSASRFVFEKNPDINTVIHFAALKSVGESTEKPLLYYDNNINSLLSILALMKEFKVPNLVFSSSCTVYGNVASLPVKENTPFGVAESPYGRTKQLSEYIIQDFLKANPFHKSAVLRYFNPAGAHPSALIGEAPLVMAQSLVPTITETAIGIRDKMYVHGNNYNTRDGTCVRDYIHIMDLARAHVLAIHFLQSQTIQNHPEIFNLGIGEGVTVMEAINAFEKISGQALYYEMGPARKGDVEAIYANHDKATKVLNWLPELGIDEIMLSAWKWEKKKKEILDRL